MIRLKRVYEPATPDDGQRVLVERLWPRGVSKQRAGIDLWFKQIAPTPELRRWFAHDPAKWERFCSRYWQQLDGQGDLIQQLAAMAKQGTVTFVFAAKDLEHNSAVALKAYLEGLSAPRAGRRIPGNAPRPDPDA